MRLLRLSLFNIKKSKREALAIVFLTLITTFMFSVFLANGSRIDHAFDESIKASGSVNRLLLIGEEKYHDEFKKILEEEYHPERLSENRYIYCAMTDVLDNRGEPISHNLLFVTNKTERQLEDFVKTEAMTEEEILQVEHPIWLPDTFRISKGYVVGDSFTVLKATASYPFTVVGFYESGLQSSDAYGFKCVISDEDFDLFSMIFDSGNAHSYTGLGFDGAADFSLDDFIDRCEASSSENIRSDFFDLSFENEKANETVFLSLYLMMTVFLSLVTFVASLFMIRHKISNDIEDQMQQIGVLEALGYRSREISLAYLYEYILSGGLGAILGGILALAITPALDQGIMIMLGRTMHDAPEWISIILVIVIITVLVTLFALLKAHTVKKYPPVVAFRRGINAHHFGKNPMPLTKMKGSVNCWLALKGFLSDIRSGIGVAVCIITAGTTVLFALMMFVFFKDGTKSLEYMMGADVNIIMVNLMSDVDPVAIKDEIAALPEVEKAMVTYDMEFVSVKDAGEPGQIMVYEDFGLSDTLRPCYGKVPEHDNEVMIGFSRAQKQNLSLGDQITLTSNGLEKSYIITGIISSMMNSGTVLYMTPDGYKRIRADGRAHTIYVYPAEGVSLDDLETAVSSHFGMSAKESMEGGAAGDSVEDKIRAAAQEKIAVLLSQYGVTDVDYAIRIGDQMISGNSRDFVIKEINSYQGIIKSQMAPIAEVTKKYTLIAAILISLVIGVILAILSSSNVRRLRHSLGIMKSLGYSSRDLMTQMALKFLPVTLFSVLLASICVVLLNSFFWRAIFGVIANANPFVILMGDVGLILFCYAVTYFSAGRIKKISVTELMTE
ncbi:MAG: FtsX-like permease family protein [Lachnospiraceae bacterium]|nr:FtsX-like permease family protein [Lachnospiraceae bacterium]